MALQNRIMTLVAFLQAQNCSNLPGSWRHPATMLDFLTPEYYQRIARTLEDGKIQMAFFDDRLALPDIYTDHHAEAIDAGVRAVKLDPCTIMMAMGMVPEGLGLRRADRQAQHLAPAIVIDPDRDDHRDRDDATVAARLHIGRVQPDIRPLALERPIEEGRDLAIDLAAQPADPRLRGGRLWLLEMPVMPIALTSSSTERVETPWT
jgi:hypothetical protein